MSRRSEGARLWAKPAEHDAAGRLRKRSVWIVRERGYPDVGTGVPVEAPADVGDPSERRQVAADLRRQADLRLGEIVRERHNPRRQKNRPLDEILVTDVLAVYAEDVVGVKQKAADKAREEGRALVAKRLEAGVTKASARLLQLAKWWGDKVLDDVDGKSVRAYEKMRTAQPWKAARPEVTGNPARLVTAAGVRRELDDLAAAINHYHREGHVREVVVVPKPKRSPPRKRWLTEGEAAQLLWTMWRRREQMTVRRGLMRAGEKVASRKRPHAHLARFLLVALYTGSRAGIVCSAGFEPSKDRGWVDLQRGVFHRRPEDEEDAGNKRAPPIPIPGRLLAHLRRWKRLGISKHAVVEYNGQPVADIGKGFAVAVGNAGLRGRVTPHTLRHTLTTWLMQRGADLWDSARFLGMTVETLERVYGHHREDFLTGIGDALTKRGVEAPAAGEGLKLDQAFLVRRKAA